MSKLFEYLGKIRRDNAGNALMIGAVTLPMLVGAAGLGLDTVQWTLRQREMQRAADSAAIAGAYAYLQNANVQTQANLSLTRDGMTGLTTTPIIENAPTAGIRAGDANAVRVVLATEHPMAFSALFLNRAPTIRVAATATSLSNGDFCVLALENTATVGITMQGNATTDLGCGIATNSIASNAVVAGGSSVINASPVAAVGGLSPSSNYAPGTELLPNSIIQRDPFADLPQPVLPTNCSNELRVNSNQTRTVSGSSSGVCFRGMRLQGTVHFQPGVYYIDGGSFDVGAQARVTGSNVTFILTSSTAGTNPGSIPQITINGGATMQLSATTSGTYAGVLFYQDRRAPNTDGNRINGNSNSSYQGAFYLPGQGMQFNGTAGMRTECIQMAARRVTFIGNSTITNVCPPNSGAGAFSGLRVFLVE
ncbi:MAG: pilus assembly protein TadG-related protein [Erythrobacter sp.]